MRAALLASFLAGLGTGVGGAFIALIPHLSRKIYDTLLGFSAGVMLAAGAVALLGPALRQNGALTVASGLACGALLVFFWNERCLTWNPTSRRTSPLPRSEPAC